jgi:hypothetical protein
MNSASARVSSLSRNGTRGSRKSATARERAPGRKEQSKQTHRDE